MKERLLRRLTELDRRVMLVAMAAMLALVAIECWLLVLRAPLVELRNQTAARADLAATNADSGKTTAQIERLKAELPRIEEALVGESSARSEDRVILFLMDVLGRVGARHGVALGSVRPGARRTIERFEETTYDIEVRGDYRSLYQWLHEAQPSVAPLVVTGITLRSIDEGQRVALALKLADYRPVTVHGKAP